MGHLILWSEYRKMTWLSNEYATLLVRVTPSSARLRPKLFSGTTRYRHTPKAVQILRNDKDPSGDLRCSRS
jgi:hypothetical protein